jgi:lipoprotein-releasing system permease protein
VTAIWDLLVGTGTALTLTVIVMIALALNALALFYLSSAVLVLERFARRVRRVRWVFVFAVLVVAVTGSLSLEEAARLELGPSPLFASSSLIFGGWALVTSVSILLCWAGLQWLSPARLGTLTLLALGGAASLWIGAAGRLEFALVPVLAVAGVASVVTLRRKLGAESSPTRSIGTGERQLRWLAAALLPGPLLAAALPEPSAGLHQAGLAVLQAVAMLIAFGMLPLAAAGLVEMRRSAEWFLAVRYLIARRRQVYISAVTLLCVGGIAAGVWLIVTVLSVMNGFERAWREQIVGDVAHFTVHSGLGRISDYQAVMDTASSVPGVEDVSPYLDAEGMVRSADGRLFGVRLRGIDPTSADRVTGISGRLVDGSLEALSTRQSPDAPPGIVIGEPLAEKLGAGLGTELVLISPLGGPPTPLGPAPRLKRFRVVGTFRSQLYQFGEVYTYVNLPDAQDFLRAGDVVDGIEARTADLYTSRRVAGRVRATLDSPYYTRDWKDHFPVFFAALRDNRSMMTLLLGMIMVVAAFMIVATLMMMIMEKSSDIAILKAMGAEDATIERVFAIEGALIGMAGTTVGVLAGLAVTSRLAWIQTTIEAITGVDTLPQSIYQLSTLPADHDPLQIFGVAAMAMVLALGATLVPARQGARFDPVEGLRSE